MFVERQKSLGMGCRPQGHDIRSDSIFYALVDLKWGSSQPPDVFIVPSQVVADAIGQAFKSEPALKRRMFWIWGNCR
jgi:hypothetical protein